jgi:hypothetical protein
LNEYAIEDPFAAAELEIGYEYADKSSDTFSVSLILLSRLTGLTGTELKTSATPHVFGPDSRLKEWIDLSLLERFFADTLSTEPPMGEPLPGTGRLSADQCYERINELLHRLR